MLQLGLPNNTVNVLDLECGKSMDEKKILALEVPR